MVFLAMLAAAISGGVGNASGRDWFVEAGAQNGDGTREKPFADPWQALEKCEAGDAIHVTEGRYSGKLDSGQWEIPFDRIQLIGGYAKGFSARDPWKHRTELIWDRASKNWPMEARVVSRAKENVLDGLVLDMREQNDYVDETATGRSEKPGKEAVYLWHPATVRNCMFLNTGREGLICRNGSTIENNLFLNVIGAALRVDKLPGADEKLVGTIRNNTFVWSWDARVPGKGGFDGAGVHLRGHANVTQNIFAHCDNNAIYCEIDPAKTSVTRNVFFMNLFSSFKMFVEGRDVAVDQNSMELLEECGLKAFDGNEILNPELPLDPAWMDRASRRTAAQPGKVVMDDWSQLRRLLGLPLVGQGGREVSGLAPAYPGEKAAALLAPGNAAVKAGARVVKLEAKFADAAVAEAKKAYEPADLLAWARKPETVSGKALEMVVAISSAANIGGIPDSYRKDDHEGIFLHDSQGTERITGFYRKGTAVNRVVSEGAGRCHGLGKADRLYVVRGIAYRVASIPRAAFHIESIAPYEAAVEARVEAGARPQGRDWFVRAGAAGGDGSREKPFRDPFQALERCEAGDTIHVAGGEYAGRLRAGIWRVDCPFIALLGGYDREFATRDPWKNPTLLHCPPEFKGRRGGNTLEGADDHTGFILDGFVFDKKLNNLYKTNGDLDYTRSDSSEHVWLSRPDCVIRNCVFINGALGALRLASAQTVENCIIVNHYLRAVAVEQGHAPGTPFVFRNNTVLFAWDKRFGEGRGNNGDLLVLGGGVRAVVEDNIFAFADNHAIRLDAEPRDVELRGNVFSHNLWAEVFRTAGFTVVDQGTFGQLADLGWKKCEGNEVLIPGIPVDENWFNVYLGRTAYVPGKVAMDDWNRLREMLGQPLVSQGGKPAEGMAPAYDRTKTLDLWPKNPSCKAGARPRAIAVKFEGIERKEEQHEYAEVSWEAAKDAAEWQKLDGRRVQLEVSIRSLDNQYQLEDVKEADHLAFMVGGSDGADSVGQWMRCYVKRGTRYERAVRQSKGYSTGRPEDEQHLLKGVARKNRQFLVEAVEKGE